MDFFSFFQDAATLRKVLWRGMKNVEVTSEFELKGGQ
jgi:hypothetical protein